MLGKVTEILNQTLNSPENIYIKQFTKYKPKVKTTV